MTEIKEVERFVYDVAKEGDMRVPARIYADDEIIQTLKDEEKQDWSSLRQLKNIATLPGLEKRVLALADVHPGYGSPIGGVFASDLKEGVITFAGVGFDINCGVHGLVLPLSAEEIEAKKKELTGQLMRDIPAGLGVEGAIRLTMEEMDEVLEKGVDFVLEKGYGVKEDAELIEEKGRMEGADPANVSEKAKRRALKELGTLGSGNHYLDVHEIAGVFDEEAAKAYGLEKGGSAVTIHCGSRALGHQIGTDYLNSLDNAVKKYGIKIMDREMVCAPVESEEGQEYFSAVKAGINFAFANRQVIAALTRKSFAHLFGIGENEIKTLYDVGHNTAKVERHNIAGKEKDVLVQRKGSTRGFGPGREEVPERYRKAGQPVIIGGTMGSSSFILKGTEKAMEETFGSTIHGAGRAMSRTKAKKSWSGLEVQQRLAEQGIIVRAHSKKGIAEEAPKAYKDVSEVVGVMHEAGISEKVAELRPRIVIIG